MSELIRNLPLPVSIMDRDFRYIAVSERFLQSNEVPLTEVIGR